jgi:nitrate/nitrite transporter NarK
MKSEGKLSKAPLTEAFGEWKNLKIVILALIGLTAGQAVVWYTGQFYSLFFLTQTLKVDNTTANYLIAFALLAGTPFFVIFGTLSDRIGRKPIIMAGCLLAVLTYFPLFQGITHYANPALESAQQRSPVVVVADPATCHFQFEAFAAPGKPKYADSCDLATSVLAKASVSYTIEPAPAGSVAQVKIGDKTLPSFEGGPLDSAAFKTQAADFGKSMATEIKAAGYPAKADDAAMNKPMVWLLLTILVIYVTMVYGPIAAMLVEMFPTRIRYSSMSLPYHIGNGWFGGFLPPIAFALVAYKGNIYSGLWYPIVIAAITLVVGTLFVRETKDVDIYAN